MTFLPKLPRAVFRLAIMASAAVPSACASVNITRLYSGQRSIDEVSTIMWDPSGTPRFEKLDDTALPQNKLQVQRVEFLPGAHTFTIRVANENPNGPLVTITRETSAGHCYLLRKEIMAVSVDVSGKVVAPNLMAPVLDDTTAAACPRR